MILITNSMHQRHYPYQLIFASPLAAATCCSFISLRILIVIQGTSYTLAHLTLPTLALLPNASAASAQLTNLQSATTRTTLTLASVSSLSLITAFTLASKRNKHPYLLWTALVSFAAGQGVEWWFNGFERFPTFRARKTVVNVDEGRGRRGLAESEYVSIGRESSEGREEQVNGEKVEMEMGREKKVQSVRTFIAGLGFMMGVVGIWGDGA